MFNRSGRNRSLFGAAVITLVLLASAAPVQAQTSQRCFTETGFCISGRIRTFWEQNGGLPVFGFPISAQAAEALNGGSFQSQWFERARLELHPENTPPYDVLLGRLGVDALTKQGRDWFAFPKVDEASGGDAENCRFFKETGHTVCGEFRSVYLRYGLNLGQKGTSFDESLALFGLPLSQPITETLEDGKQYTIQWFERARFELHPENKPPYTVLFGLLGAQLHGRTPVTTQPATVSLVGTTWQLDSFGPLNQQQAAAAKPPAPLAFDAAGRISGSTGCNGFGGAYTASDTQIQFGQVISTLIACEDATITKQESEIFRALQGTVRYERNAGTLRLFYDQDKSALTYHATAAVTGNVTYRQRIALPPNAEIKVQLVDVSRADAPAIVIDEQTIFAGGNQVPFAFSLVYDPATIKASNSYAVQARITVDGKLTWISTSRFAVITQGNPTTIDVIVNQV